MMHLTFKMLARVESLIPLTEEGIAEENSRLMLYFKHVKTLEDQFSAILSNYELLPFD